MAADETKLGELHNQVAEMLTTALKGTELPAETDPETGEVINEATVIPPSAAIITSAIQFLKNNGITCTPSQDNKLGELEQAMKEQRERRAARATPTRADLVSATEQTAFLQGLPN